MKHILCIIMCVTFVTALPAQNKGSWKDIDKMLEKGAYNEAYPKAMSLFENARRSHDSRQILTAAYMLHKIASNYQEGASDSAILRYESVLPLLSLEDQALCHAFLAECYRNYELPYRPKRVATGNGMVLNSTGLDALRDWTPSQFDSVVAMHIEASIRPAALLQSIDIHTVERFCDTADRKSLLLTPTLYDLLMYNAIDLAEDFAKERQLLHQLKNFHQGDTCLSIYIDAEILAFDFRKSYVDAEISPFDHKASSSVPFDLEAQRVLSHYRGTRCEQVAEIYSMVASWLKENNRLVEAKHYCDTAVALFPKSLWAAEAGLLRQEITLPHINVECQTDQMSNHALLARTSYSNLNTLYFRIIRKVELQYDEEKDKQKLLKQKALKQWNQKVPSRDDYGTSEAYNYLPPMPGGEYSLLVSASPDFKQYGFKVVDFCCCDAQFVKEQGLSGYLIHRGTGAPIVGQNIYLYADRNHRQPIYTVVTDSVGHFEFVHTSHSGSAYIRTTYDGCNLDYYSYCLATDENPSNKREANVFFDRPIYRPGDTVSFAAVAYCTDHRIYGEVLAGEKVRFVVFGINHRPLDTIVAVTDAVGSANGQYILPDDSQPGSYSLYVYAAEQLLRCEQFVVEAYRQPKFMVSLASDSLTHHFGDSLWVEGRAFSYTGIPLDGARVEWRVERSDWTTSFLGRWSDFYVPLSETECVSMGFDTLDAQGSFRIAFVPLPDPAEKSRRNVFSYRVVADVTDINGETHSQEITLQVGTVNSWLSLEGEDQIRSFDEVTLLYATIDGIPLQGAVGLTLERLEVPSEPHLRHPLAIDSLPHSLSQEEFERQFPLMAYHPTDLDVSTWRSTRVLSYPLDTRKEGFTPLSLPALSAGVYRLSAEVVDQWGDTIRDGRVFCLTPSNMQTTQSLQLMWSDVDKEQARMGETVTLRLGSLFDSVTAYCVISSGDSVIRRQLIHLHKEINKVPLIIDSGMLGGVDIILFAEKENVECRSHYHIDVPYTHKQLEVKFHSFRDKLLPGTKETWTLTVRSTDSLPITDADYKSTNQQINSSSLVTCLMTMYDAALDSYCYRSWRLNPWFSRQSGINLWSVSVGSSGHDYQRYATYPKGDWLEPQGWSLSFSESGSFYGVKSLKYAKSVNSISSIVAVVGGVGYEESVEMSDASRMPMSNRGSMRYEESVTTSEASMAYGDRPEMEDLVVVASGEKESMPQLRTNMSTLAFFRPSMRVAPDGSLSVSFTAPDLLTRWHVHSLVWSHDLKVGSIDTALVTEKPLMVVPNLPRFFRQGDSVEVSVKVSNRTDTLSRVEVRFSLMDAATMQPFYNGVRLLKIPPQSSQSLSFPVNVPHDVYVATYRVIAQGGSGDDGEQGQVPVLSSRRLVTESLAMYLGGRESKRYEMEHLAASNRDSVRRNTQLLKVEFVSNPIWYAVEALPYVEQVKNPSNIYLMNSLYADCVSSHIVAAHPVIADQLQQWRQSGKRQSELDLNEEVKQTLLDETPWVGDAEDEAQQRQQIARFFDAERLTSQQAETQRKLETNQGSDGGWSWMPGSGESSRYVTQYVLKMNGQLVGHTGEGVLSTRSLQRALAFVDAEVYDYYRRHKDDRHNAVNIDYLYTRSFYEGKSFTGKSRTAYDHYYGCLKNDVDSSRSISYSLYTQAQQALIFHRHGDRQLAQKVLARIKSKALYSDEMGMYWRDNQSGCFWYERPVEVQSLLIEAFSAITPDDKESVELMRQWLLKQKQTTRWNSDIATVNAVGALLDDTDSIRRVNDDIDVRVGRYLIPHNDGSVKDYSYRWTGEDVTPEMGEVRLEKKTDGIAWGTLYWQYFAAEKDVKANHTGLGLEKQLFKVEADGSLRPLRGDTLRVGDRVLVRLYLSCDRDFEYLELKDARASSFEPTSTTSGWRWSNGLSYYVSVKNSSTSFFINRLNKGKYQVEYEVFLNNAGDFAAGVATLQCLYAPEFRANTDGTSIVVAD